MMSLHSDHRSVRLADKLLRSASRISRLVLSLLAIAGLTYAVSSPKAPVVHLNHIENSSLSYGSPYQISETYGGTNPIDTCTGCDFWGKQQTGTSSPPSTQPSDIVNPTTGDVSDSYTLFSQPDPGENFGFTLTYDSQWGQLQEFYDTLLNTVGNEFYGFGWRSNLSTQIVDSNCPSGPQSCAGYAFVGPSGGTEWFYPTSGGSCPTGTTSKTLIYSPTFCAADRVDGLLGAYSNYSEYLFFGHGGRQSMTYDFFGEVTNEGSYQEGTNQTILWRQLPNQSGCPAMVDNWSTDQCTAVFDQAGRSYDVAWRGANNQYTVTGVKDPTGAIWVIGVDIIGQLGDVYSPLNPYGPGEWAFNYTYGAGAPDQNDLSTIQDPNGFQTTIGYTPAGTNGGYVSSVTDPYGNQTTYSGYNYNSEQNGYSYIVNQTNPTGQTIAYQVSSNMLQLRTVDNASNNAHYSATTEYVYNGTDTSPQEIVTDPSGKSTTDNTDEVGNLLQETNSYGSTTTMYNNNDEPCWTAPPGVSYPGGTYQSASCGSPPTIGSGATLYSYDSYGNLNAVTDPDGNTTETQYDGNGNPCWKSMPGAIQGSWPACTSPPSDSTRYSYSAGDLLTSKSTPDGSGSSYGYDTTTYAYNGYGEVTVTVSPDGNVAGSNPYNYMTVYYYDQVGRFYKVLQPMGRTTTASLDAAGNVISVTDPANQITSAAYDSDERLCWKAEGVSPASCGSPPATSTRYQYNANTADPVSVIDPNGHPTTYSYLNPDAQDSPTTETDAMGNVTSTVYDLNGRQCLSGTASTSLYGGTAPTCTPQSGYTYQTFDQLGNVLTSTDPSGNTTSYSRTDDAYPSQVTTMTPPSGGSAQPTNYFYDKDGHLGLVNEGNGDWATYAYDADGQKCWQAPVANPWATCSTAVPVGGSSFGYYYSNRPQFMVDVVSSTKTNGTLWGYDAQGQLTAEGNVGGVMGYTYDYAGDNTCVAYPVSSSSSCSSPASTSNTVVNYGYDADGRMNSMADWLGNSFNFGYDTRSNLNAIQYPSASHWSEALGPYDAANNVTGLVFADPNYGYIPLSYPVNADEELASGAGVSYGYNSQDRVSTDGSDSFTYNPNGELKSDTNGSNTDTWSYDTADELTSAAANGSTNETFSYDGNGNRCGVNLNSSQPNCLTPAVGTFEYGYNAFNQLCYLSWVSVAGQSPSCSSPPATTADTFTYDGNGLRVSDTIGSTGQNFTYDTQTRAGQPLIIKDGSNAYLYGPPNFTQGSAPLEQISLSSSSPSYLLSTPSGVGTQTNSGGTITAQVSYSAFGKQTVTSGTMSTPFGFQGNYSDSPNLLYLINRYYDPSTAQFLSVDPDVMKTGQPYVYTDDDPLNATDPLGLDKVYVIQQRNGKIKYVGRTNKPPRRQGEHKRSGLLNEKAGDKLKVLETDDLTTSQAKGLEQSVMNLLKRVGVKTENRVNSVSTNNPAYSELVQEGNDILMHSEDSLQLVSGGANEAAVQFQVLVGENAVGVDPNVFGASKPGGGPDDAPAGDDIPAIPE
jgi:RHS repeat-associated protein